MLNYTGKIFEQLKILPKTKSDFWNLEPSIVLPQIIFYCFILNYLTLFTSDLSSYQHLPHSFQKWSISLSRQTLLSLNYPTQVSLLAKTSLVMSTFSQFWVSLALDVCTIHLSLIRDISCIINYQLLQETTACIYSVPRWSP